MELYKPINAIWEITMGCNMRCKHCGSICKEQFPDELSTSDAKTVCKKLADAGTKYITLSGGEPTLRDDWHVIASELNKNGITPSLISNGWLIDEEVADKAAESGINSIAISLDGMRDTHDFMRCEGSFDRIVKAIALLNKKKVGVSIITAINSRTLSELPEMVSLLRKFDIAVWQMQTALPMGSFSEHKDDLMILPNQVDRIINFAHDNKDSIPICLADCIGYYTKKEKEVRESSIMDDFVWNGCPAGKYSIGILQNGDIIGCTSVRGNEFIEGNILRDDFNEIWEHGFSWNRDMQQNKLNGFCGICMYGSICLGGCANSRYCNDGSIYGENLYCSYRNYVFSEVGNESLQCVEIDSVYKFVKKHISHGSYNVVIEYLLKLLGCNESEKKLNRIDLLNYLHFPYFKIGNHSKSIDICNEVLALDENNPYAIHGLILNYTVLGAFDEAKERLKALKSISPDEYNTTVEDIRAILSSSDYKEELERLLKV
jgi:radical SAM protein with 4Fe4S-binding SPASM domain